MHFEIKIFKFNFWVGPTYRSHPSLSSRSHAPASTLSSSGWVSHASWPRVQAIPRHLGLPFSSHSTPNRVLRSLLQAAPHRRIIVGSPLEPHAVVTLQDIAIPTTLGHFLLHFTSELSGVSPPAIAASTVYCRPNSWMRPVIPGFMPKPSTHRMHDLGSIVPHIRPKLFTDNQIS
jgi:hypothetical protein